MILSKAFRIALSVAVSFVLSWLGVSFFLNNDADTLMYLLSLMAEALCVTVVFTVLLYLASRRFQILFSRAENIMNSGVFMAFILVFFNL